MKNRKVHETQCGQGTGFQIRTTFCKAYFVAEQVASALMSLVNVFIWALILKPKPGLPLQIISCHISLRFFIFALMSYLLIDPKNPERVRVT